MPEVAIPVWALVLAGLALAAAGALIAARRARPRPLSQLAPAASPRSAAQTLSHEIRTPLTLVKGAADLLAEETPGPLTDTQRYFVDTIVQNTQHVIDMAENFLLDVRLSRADLALDLSEVEMRALVRETVQELRRVRHTSVALDNRGEPLPIRADARLVRQVLWNLVNNAVRHAGPEAEITVRVSSGDEGVTVAVGDDGVGMTPQQRRELFTPYETGADQAGTGLGMAILRRIVDAHGGRVAVDTLTARGTTIMVVLPWAGRG